VLAALSLNPLVGISSCPDMPRSFIKAEKAEPADAAKKVHDNVSGKSLESLRSMMQVELREQCRIQGFSQCGSKEVLAQRLFQKLNPQEPLPESVQCGADPSSALAMALQMQKTLQAQQEQITSLTSQLGRLTDNNELPAPNASAQEKPLDDSPSLGLVQDQPPAKKARGRPPKSPSYGLRSPMSPPPPEIDSCLRFPMSPLPPDIYSVLQDEQDAVSGSNSRQPAESSLPMTLPPFQNASLSQEGQDAALSSAPIKENISAPPSKTRSWQRFRVPSGAESGQTSARIPPGAKRSLTKHAEHSTARISPGAKIPAATVVQNTAPSPSQSLFEAKKPVSTEIQKAGWVPDDISTAAKTKVVAAIDTACVSDPASSLEVGSPKTPVRTPRLARLFPTTAHKLESTLASTSHEQIPPCPAAPDIEDAHGEFYAEVRRLFRLSESDSLGKFAELSRIACQLLSTLRSGDSREPPAKRTRVSEAHRALEHVLEVVSMRLAPAEDFAEPPSKHQPDEPPEESCVPVPVTSLPLAPGCWHSKGDLRWAHVELGQALASVSTEGSDGTRTVSRQAIESWLDTPAADRIRAFHLEGGCRRTAELMTEDELPILDRFIERVLYEANICHAPFSGFRDAEEDEVRDMPKIFAAFGRFLQDEVKLQPSTLKPYLESFGKCFRYDGKSPAEMATLAYLDRSKHTYEDALCNHIMACSLSRFSVFWQKFGSRPFTGDADASGVFSGNLLSSPLTRRQPEEGDGSESARHVDMLPASWRSDVGTLPEGWHVHGKTQRILAWTSPTGEWHMKKSELVRRLACLQLPPPLFYVPPPPVATPEKQPRPEREKMTFLPLSELLNPVPKTGEQGAAEERDRKLLPQVITTFMRLGNGRTEHRECTRKAHAMTLFKIVSDSQRSFEALTEPSFFDLMYRCSENKRNHGAYTSAIRCFSEFWEFIGGYDGDFDVADREMMQRSLHVKPSLVDHPGGEMCGYGGICGGDLCRWSKRWCETCGTVLRCGKHEEHSQQMCREIFWSKHRADGTPVRTIADFFGTKAAKKTAPAAIDGATGTGLEAN